MLISNLLSVTSPPVSFRPGIRQWEREREKGKKENRLEENKPFKRSQREHVYRGGPRKIGQVIKKTSVDQCSWLLGSFHKVRKFHYTSKISSLSWDYSLPLSARSTQKTHDRVRPFFEVTSFGDTLKGRLKRSWNIHAVLKHGDQNGDTISLDTRVYYALSSKCKLDRVERGVYRFLHRFKGKNCPRWTQFLEVGKKRNINSKVCLHLVHYTDCNLRDKAVVRKVNEEKSSRQNFFIFSVY